MKPFLKAVLLALALSLPMVRLLERVLPSSEGFFGFNPLVNPIIAIIFGLLFSLPTALGVVGFFSYCQQLKKLPAFIVVPILFVNLVWLLDDKVSFMFSVLFGLVLGSIGVGIGWLLQKIIGKLFQKAV